MSVLFTFPGQGSQRPGMLHALPSHAEAARTLQEASDTLGYGVTSLDDNSPVGRRVSQRSAPREPCRVLRTALQKTVTHGFELERAVGWQAVQAAQQLNCHRRGTRCARGLADQRRRGNRRLDDCIERTGNGMCGVAQPDQRERRQNLEPNIRRTNIQVNKAQRLRAVSPPLPQLGRVDQKILHPD